MTPTRIENLWAKVAMLSAHPAQDGFGYEMSLPGGRLFVSDEGMRRLVLYADLMARFGPALAALDAVMSPVCGEHGLPLFDVNAEEPFRWFLNDYAPMDERTAWFSLGGWHEFDHERGFVYCIAAWARGTPGGDLVLCQGDWNPLPAQLPGPFLGGGA